MREVAGGQVGLTLETELDGATALLDAAGVAVERHVAPMPAAPAAETVLSWAVREGATNVLRHSSATWCRIVVTRDDGGTRLEMVNDGATARAGEGTGLTGLTERAVAAGGSLTARRAVDATFHLTVTVPRETA